MSGWGFLVCVLMGGFMAWRERYPSAPAYGDCPRRREVE
jgi:hypothetical protein